MKPIPDDQAKQEKAEDAPDITMTASGEKEPGEDPDFDDSEIADGGAERG